jgi:hypothetical protein
MEAVTADRLKELHRTLASNRRIASMLMGRSRSSARDDVGVALRVPSPSFDQSVPLAGAVDVGAHADILGQFSDAIDFVRTACAALESDERTTFAVPCLRLALDMLDRAYNNLDDAGRAHPPENPDRDGASRGLKKRRAC